ncbi:MAG: nicotinate-nucleotide--dimethylbenzimidazole phosphoribosyltransferase [Salinispira sp.]
MSAIPDDFDDLEERIRQRINSRTKPLGSLGKLEDIAARIALMQNSLNPQLSKPAMLVFAADHGIAASSVSPYPQDVTWQMVMNFLSGGAAINVFCKQHDIDFKIIDAGVNYRFPPDVILGADQGIRLIDRKIAYGTRNFLLEPAMSGGERERALNIGAELAAQEYTAGCNIIAMGDMGIGNSTSAAMLMSEFCGIDVENCVGRGAGLDDAGVRHKKEILKQHVSARASAPRGALEILARYGGFEIAMICGAMIEAARKKMIILVDGFIATAANIAAAELSQNVRAHSIYTHRSGEQGHAEMLRYLGAEAILDIGMRLGEGSGAAVAYPIIQSAVLFFNEMAGFDTAGVSVSSL